MFFKINLYTEKQRKNGLAFFEVVASITNLSTVFRRKNIFFLKRKKIVSLQLILEKVIKN